MYKMLTYDLHICEHRLHPSLMCELTQKREVAASDISVNLQIVNSLIP